MASPSSSSDIDKRIKAQVATVDNMLLNAWGTIYKMAVKYLAYDKISYELSPTEEMLSAKNIAADLCSILDHCCMILCYNSVRGIPSPKRARQINFPCVYDQSDTSDRWELQQLKLIDPKVDHASHVGKYRGIFSKVQFQGTADPDVVAFYQLHFLRNTLLHQSIVITGNNEGGHTPLILKHSHIDRNTKAAITVNLPTKPWDRDSREKKPQPLVDVLYSACIIVQDRRDKLLGIIGEKKLGEKFGFHFTEKMLEITFKQATRCTINCNQLHLECYGMEAELKEYLKELRAHEYN